MSNEQTEALAVNRAERFAKDVHCTAEEHDDIMVAVRLARKQLATPSPAPSDTLEPCDCARRYDPDQIDHEAGCAYVRTDTLERREAIYAMLGGYQAIFNAIGDAVTRNETSLGISVEAFVQSIMPKAALSLPAREVSGERAREVLSDEISCALGDEIAVSCNDAVAAMIRFATEALATTPAPRVKYEGDAVAAVQTLLEQGKATVDADGYLSIVAPREMEADLVGAVKVLKPFAEVAAQDIGDDEADSDIFKPMTRHNHAPLLTVGDLRAAMLLLAKLDRSA